MAAIGQNSNANEYESMDFTPIPAGDYSAVITESEWKPTKKMDGQMLVMKVEVIDGQFKGQSFRGVFCIKPLVWRVKFHFKEQTKWQQ